MEESKVILAAGKTYKVITEGLLHDQVTYLKLITCSQLKVYCPWQLEGHKVSTAYWLEEPILRTYRQLPTFFEKPQFSNGWGLDILLKVEEVTGDDIPQELRD